MESKELRIGNLVATCQNDEAKNVDSVSKDIIRLDDGIRMWKFDIVDIIPVPITGVRLLKMGFEISKDGNFYGKKTNGKDYFFLTNDFQPYLPVKKDLKYIHQLQNLFYLVTGEELTFKGWAKDF